MNKIHVGALLKKYWPRILFAVICMVIGIALDMIYPQVMAKIIDDVIGKGMTDILMPLLGLILVVGIGRSVTAYFKEYTFDLVGFSAGSDVRRGLFRRIQTLSLDYFGKTNTGELMARVKDDTEMVWDAFGMCGMLTLEAIIHIGMVIFCMVRISPLLSILPIVVMIALGFLAFKLERSLDKAYGDISEKNAELTTVAEENLSGVRTVKAFTREEYEIEKFLKKNNEYCDLNMKMSKILIRQEPLFQFIGNLMPVLMAILGGFFVARDELSVGELVAFVEYSRNITWPMQLLGELANEYSEVIASFKKINKVLKNEPNIKNPEDAIVPEKIYGRVTFDHVYFTKNDKKILTDVSFDIMPGKTLGIMGETGSGKSSLIKLIGRLFDVTDGAVKIDGIDVRNMDLTALRKAIAPVNQEVFLFSDTIKDNINMGAKNDISDDAITEASREAQASEFIEKMEDKYETVIGERGVGLSGGQKQRISIARAFAHNAPILIMDDSTSALDMETEREVQRALRKKKDCTKIIIAHRISAVRYADEIVVFKKGVIAERGTHEELLAKKGLYYETYVSQYGEKKEVV